MNATEARKLSMSNEDARVKQQLNYIKGCIKNAATMGFFKVEIYLEQSPLYTDNYLALCKEGYKVHNTTTRYNWTIFW